MRFSVLDSLRGVCALIVVLSHIEFLALIHSGHLHGIGILEHSFLFVDFFFVLSGFVLAHGYFSKIQDQKDVFLFMVRRFGRVYPLHILILAAFICNELFAAYVHSPISPAGAPPFSSDHTPKGILTNILLIQALNIHHGTTWNIPSWSISVEFYTYIVFAFYCVIMRNHKSAAIGVSICIAIASAMIIFFYSKTYMGATYDYAIFRCLYGFFCGVLAKFVYEQYVRSVRCSRWVSTTLELAVTAGVAVFVSYIWFEPRSLFAPWLFSIAVLIFAQENGAVSHILATSPFQFLGKRSYAIYISHAFVLTVFVSGLTILGNNEIIHFSVIDFAYKPDNWKLGLIDFHNYYGSDAVVVLIIICVILVSCVLHTYVEEPGRMYFNGLAKRLKIRQSRKAVQDIQFPAVKDAI